jgi:hypothetical protein
MRPSQPDASVVAEADAGQPCMDRLVATHFDGGMTSFDACGLIGTECSAVPDSGVCPNEMRTARVGPFASVGSSTGCCYVLEGFGRPLLGSDGPVVAPLVSSSAWV